MQSWGSGNESLSRRGVIGGLLAAGAMTLPGTAALARVSPDDPVHRLLTLSTRRAFSRLIRPDGFWDSAVARINLPTLFSRPGASAPAALKSPQFREQLQHLLNRLADQAAGKVEPVVAKGAGRVRVRDSAAVLNGGPTAGTTYLRQAMGAKLVNALIPALYDVMRASSDPILAEALKGLKGVTLRDAAHALAIEADNAIWYEIGASESELRGDPSLGFRAS